MTKINRNDERKEYWREWPEEELLELSSRRRPSPGKVTGTMRLSELAPSHTNPDTHSDTSQHIGVVDNHDQSARAAAIREVVTDEFGGILRNDARPEILSTDVDSPGTPNVSVPRRRQTGLETNASVLFGAQPDSASKGPNSSTGAQAVAHQAWAVGPDSIGQHVPIQRKESDGLLANEMKIQATDSGKVLPEGVQTKMESAFQADFSAVRVHEDSCAVSLGALAFTQGTDIHFAPGQYSPSSRSGQELLGHELAHVVQQSQGRVEATRQSKGVLLNDDTALETEADEMGIKAARGERVSRDTKVLNTFGYPSGPIQRKAPHGSNPEYEEWQDLISYRPGEKTQKNLLKRGMTVHKIEAGWGPISLDYYEVEVTMMPMLHGKRVTPEWLIGQLHTRMNDFVDTNISIGRSYVFLLMLKDRQDPLSNRACGFPAHGLPVVSRDAALRGVG